MKLILREALLSSSWIDVFIMNIIKKTLAEMLKKVHELGIQNVAVDLRENHGGNSMVANEFFRYLGVETYKTHTGEIRKDFKVFLPYIIQ